MKRNALLKMKSGLGLLISGLASAAPVMAHPGVAEHTHAGGPAHLLIHAVMGLPIVALVSLFAAFSVWPLLRRGVKRLTRSKDGLKQE